MQFSTIALLMGLVATGLMATPFAEPDETNVYELKVEQRKGGSVVQYGEVKRSLFPRADCGGWFQKKCPPKACHVTDVKSPDCDSKNGGTNAVCDALVNDFYGNREKELEKGARQLCWQNENGKTGCCIKWTEDVKGLIKGDLIERADYIKASCDSSGISGKYNTVLMRGVCMSFCMSKGAGCKSEENYS